MLQRGKETEKERKREREKEREREGERETLIDPNALPLFL